MVIAATQMDGLFLSRFRFWGFAGFKKTDWFKLPKKPFKLSGRMGAGKTSVVKLLLFAFTGDETLVLDSVTGREAGVELELESVHEERSERFTIQRTLDREGLKSRITDEEGRVIAENEEVKSVILQLSGENSLDSFRNVFILGSEIVKDSELMKEYVESLSGIRLLETIIERLERLRLQKTARLDELEKNLEEYEKHLEEEAPLGLYEDAEKRIDQLHRRFGKRIDRVNRELEKHKSEVAKIEETRVRLEKQVEELEKKKTNLETYKHNIGMAEEKLDLSLKRLKEVKWNEDKVLKERNELKTHLEELEESISRIVGEIEAHRSRIRELGEETGGAEQGVEEERLRIVAEEMEESIKRLEKEIEALRKQLNQKKETLTREEIALNNVLGEYEKLRKKTPELPETPILEDLMVFREKAAASLNRLTPALSSIEGELRFKRKLHQWVKRRGCPLCLKSAEELGAELKKLALDVRDLADRRNRLIHDVDELKKQSENADQAIMVCNRMKALKEMIDGWKREIDQVEAELNEKVMRLNSEKSRLNVILARIGGEIEAQEQRERELLKLTIELETAEKKKKELEERLERARKRLKEIEEHVLKQFEERRRSAENEVQVNRRKLEELRGKFDELQAQRIPEQLRSLRGRIAKLERRRADCENEIKRLESRRNIYQYAAKSLLERRERVKQVNLDIERIDLLCEVMETLKTRIRENIFHKLSKELENIDSLIGLKSLDWSRGVVTREKREWSGEQKVSTLSDAEYVATLSYLTAVLDGFRDERRKRFLLIDTVFDPTSMKRLAAVLKEYNCVQVGFLVSEEGDLNVQELEP